MNTMYKQSSNNRLAGLSVSNCALADCLLIIVTVPAIRIDGSGITHTHTMNGLRRFLKPSLLHAETGTVSMCLADANHFQFVAAEKKAKRG